MDGKYDSFTYQRVKGRLVYEEIPDPVSLAKWKRRAWAIAGLTALAQLPLMPVGWHWLAATDFALLLIAGTIILYWLNISRTTQKSALRLLTDGFEVQAALLDDNDGMTVVRAGVGYDTVLWLGPEDVASREGVLQKYNVIELYQTDSPFEPSEAWVAVYKGDSLTHALRFRATPTFLDRLLKELADRGLGQCVRRRA